MKFSCLYAVKTLFCLSLIFSVQWVYCDFSLKDKIGQMMMVGVRETEVEGMCGDVKRQIIQGDIGGVVFFSRNIKNKLQFSRFINGIRNINSKYPLFMAVDQEGGRVSRFSDKNGFRNFVSAEDVALSKTVDQAFVYYKDMADILNDVGINLNLAPICDVNINPNSPAIGKRGRSFSSNPNIVAKYAYAFIKAHQAKGVLTVLKHYPGHGSAQGDTHKGLTDVTDTWKEIEVIPFEELIKTGCVDMVMASHIVDRSVDSFFPACLSYAHINENLRGKIGYDGVVITDDLQMSAIVNHYSFQEVVINAVNAGVDILLFAHDSNLANKAIDIILGAVNKGEIEAKRIDESYQRIMKLKKKLIKKLGVNGFVRC